MYFVLVIENQLELAENLVELLEVSGVSAKHVKRAADAKDFLDHPGLCAVVANSLNLDGHVRTLSRQISEKNTAEKTEFIVLGDAVSSSHSDVVDHYFRLPLDYPQFVATIHLILGNRPSNVA